MRVAIVTDAWRPQTNGVVTTLSATARALEQAGHEVRLITPQSLFCVPCPSYPEIRLALAPGWYIGRELRRFRPHAIHIATEGPMGLGARRYCLDHRLPFTTSYHTRYPEYLRARWPIPLWLSYAAVRAFHGVAARTFVSNERLRSELAGRGFERLHLWRRGVDLDRFRPGEGALPPGFESLPRPIMAYMGRLAVEKNLGAFLDLDLPGTKLLIGDGPQRRALQQRHPEAVFAGYRFGEELAALLGAADVFVFPSLTDTYGLAMIEALACGVPVAAFPVPGPLDVIEQGVTGALDADLSAAIRQALLLDRSTCAARARAHTWAAATEEFLAGLEPIPAARRAAGRVPRQPARSAIIERTPTLGSGGARSWKPQT